MTAVCIDNFVCIREDIENIIVVIAQENCQSNVSAGFVQNINRVQAGAVYLPGCGL